MKTLLVTTFALLALTGVCSPMKNTTTCHCMQSCNTDSSEIFWKTDFAKGHPGKRSGALRLPAAWYEAGSLYIESKINQQLPYAIIAGNEAIAAEGLLNLKKDEPMVISVTDLAPGEYEIRITIDETVYAGTFYIE
nr:hypothetical protein [uncultured Schaedlerella sp.]